MTEPETTPALTITIYAQVNDGSIHPMGTATGDTVEEATHSVAALLRYGAAETDPGASFLELVLRYDEEGIP